MSTFSKQQYSMGLARQAFNIDATWVNALPLAIDVHLPFSVRARLTDSSVSRFGSLPRCRHGDWDIVICLAGVAVAMGVSGE